MAKHLDLEEQEQLDELKHFWKHYGNLITWALIAVFGSIAAWNGFQYWQRNQAIQAAAMFDEVDRSAAAADVPRLERSMADMREKFGATLFSQQAALLAAKVLFEKDKPDAAKDALTWVAEKSSDDGYAAVAKLRLAGLLVNQQAYEDALRQLTSSFPPEFAALVADRKGDVFALQGKKQEAIAEYLKALKLFDLQSEYRRLVEVKLGALGIDPDVAKGNSQNLAGGTNSGEKK